MHLKGADMANLVETSEMKAGPVRVPVMVKKNVANHLAQYVLEQEEGSLRYDAIIDDVIKLGILAMKQKKVS